MLAGAAVPNAHGKEARENAREWKWLVGRRFEHLKMFGMFVDERSPVPDVPQCQDRNKEPGKKENDDLQKIGPCRFLLE